MNNLTSDSPEVEFFEVFDDGSVQKTAGDRPNAAARPSASWNAGPQQQPRKKPCKQAQPQGPVDENGHRVVLIDDEELTVVEGDLLLDIDQKYLWQETQLLRQAQMQNQFRAGQAGFGEGPITGYGAGTSALVGIFQGGRIVRWSPGTVLTYCVLRGTFPRDEWYEEVVTNMLSATLAWEETCGVRFEYREALDSSPALRPPGILFPVRHISANGAFIASAFFPNDITSRRRVLIDPSYFATRFDHVGVLRHELGHVLGFRHEHIRSGAPAVCPDESTAETIDLTAYDPQSVMHYFCGGVGSLNLSITGIDRTGSQRVYGPSFHDFELQDV